jgi:parallel beta-helix repeat protein
MAEDENETGGPGDPRGKQAEGHAGSRTALPTRFAPWGAAIIVAVILVLAWGLSHTPSSPTPSDSAVSQSVPVAKVKRKAEVDAPSATEPAVSPGPNAPAPLPHQERLGLSEQLQETSAEEAAAPAERAPESESGPEIPDGTEPTATEPPAEVIEEAKRPNAEHEPTVSQTLVVPDEFASIQAAVDAAERSDTVYVRAGEYGGQITFKEGINLVGEGADRVTVRTSARLGPVLRVDGCEAGLVSGLTLEHAGLADDMPEEAVLLVRDSTIEVFRCTVQKGAKHGVKLDGGGRSLVRECVVRDNVWSGILVTGAATTPVLRADECAGNGGSGVYFEGGAGGLADSNACTGSGQSGISVAGRGTAPTLRNNRCLDNQKHGIYFENGAGGLAEDNLCERNAQAGIGVFLAGTAPILRKNRCKQSGKHGICFAKGAHGAAELNFCEKNALSGIAVFDPGTAPRVRENRCWDNAYGIYLGERTAPKLKGNTLDGNSEFDLRDDR